MMYKHILRNALLEAGLIVLFLAIGAAVLLISSSVAKAEVTRGCKGTFNIKVLNSSENLTTSKYYANLDTFEGRGACKNKHHGNTCRKRAKDNIFRCANDIWDNRWNLIGDPNDNNHDMILPAICRGDKTGARKVGFKTNPHGKGTDIKYAMEYNACCVIQPGADKVDLRLEVTSSGDKGCGPKHSITKKFVETRTLESLYEVDCKRVIEKGYCAKRTGG